MESIRCLLISVESSPGHDEKWLFPIALIKVILTGEAYAPCRNCAGLCFILSFLMMNAMWCLDMMVARKYLCFT